MQTVRCATQGCSKVHGGPRHLHNTHRSVSHNNLLRRLLMFHGPIDEAVPFFEAMGFRCPERKDHASFLQEVTTPKGRPFSGH